MPLDLPPLARAHERLETIAAHGIADGADKLTLSVMLAEKAARLVRDDQQERSALAIAFMRFARELDEDVAKTEVAWLH